MRLLLLVMIAACNTKQPVARQELVKPAPAKDPQAGSGDPKWANDPPAVLRDKILSVNAHVIVLKSQATFAEYRDVLATAERTPGVIAAEPFIFAELAIAKPGKPPVDVAVKAVDPSRVGRVLTIGSHMKSGKLDSLAATSEPAPILLGDDLARKLDVRVGDTVTLTARNDETKVAPTAFRITGLFHIDFDVYDGELAFVPLSTMQAMVGRGDQVMGIEMTVSDLEHSGDLAETIEEALGGPPYQAQDWYELNSRLFRALYGDRRP